MPVTLDGVVGDILRAELATETLVGDALSAIERSGRKPDGTLLLGELRSQGSLTPWQTKRLESNDVSSLRIGNYLLLNELGAGAMGVVYKALHRRMRRIVAIKLLKQETGLTDEFVQRFYQEVEAAARLNHANAVAAYDAGDCALGPYLVMEYVEGTDLKEVLDRTGPFSVDAAVAATLQSAAALEYAHSQGIVHRDIKPANLMRDIEGVVKVADLGLARLASPTDGDDEDADDRPASVSGTIDFMPPEQAVDSNQVDHRADIYSLGCTLFSLLTGRPVYDGDTLVARVMAHANSPIPSLRKARNDIPVAVDAIYQRMIAKDPADRYQSMADVTRDLEAFRDESGDDSEWNPGDATIYVVETSSLQSKMIAKLVNNIGAGDVHAFSTPFDALESLPAVPPEILLTSLELEEMSGVELAQRVRDDLRWARIGVVLMTSSDLSPATKQFVRETRGMFAIRKPFDSDALLNAMRESMRQASGTDASISSLAGVPVLIVDDSTVARRRIREVLSDLGFTTFTDTADGVEAVAELERSEYRLVVTDYNMPNMDGYQLVRHIRETESTAAIPVIMVTTEYDPTKLAEVYQLGVSAICNKSFDPELVRNIVIRLFK